MIFLPGPANAITFKLRKPTESVTFKWKRGASYTFELNDAGAGNGMKIKLPPANLRDPNGLSVVEGVVSLHYEVVNVHVPELENAPQLIASLGTRGEFPEVKMI